MKSIRLQMRFWFTAYLFIQAGFFVKAEGQQTLHGHVPAAVARLGLKPIGRLSEAVRLKLAIGLPLRNKEELNSLFKQIYNPGSSKYHHYLTSAQFTEEFGPAESDYQAVKNFVEMNGLTVTATHQNRAILDVSGTVADIEKAFQITIYVYHHPAENRTFFAPDIEPSVNTNVPVSDINGLNNYSVPHPNLHKQSSLTASGSAPYSSYHGRDFRNAYIPDDTLSGYGQSVGLVEFDGYYLNDIQNYESQAGLPQVPIQNILIDDATGIPNADTNWVAEVSLDIELAISMAPNLARVCVFEGNKFYDILDSMVARSDIKQFSCSWLWTPGFLSTSTMDNFFLQMAVQGQSFFAASGDGDAIVGGLWGPTDDTLITIVGGTTLTMNGNGISYNSEKVWDWGYDPPGWDGNGYWGSSGGVSTSTSIPTWQQNINMSSNGGSTTMRNIPDVAMTADGIWVNYMNGLYGIFGGTSCAAPLWAGFIALVNQKAIVSGAPPVGFINPAIYSIAQSSSYAADFHDITAGNNAWPGSSNNFSAVAGYDLCTGLGSPAGRALINDLTLYPSITSISPAVVNRLQTLNDTITGSGFTNGSTSVSFGPNIIVNSVIVNSSTQLVANITVTASASTGSRTVYTADAPVGRRGSLSNGLTINNPVPTLSNITPSSGNRLQTLDVIFSGTNFIAGVTGIIAGPEITVNSVKVNSATNLTANLTISAAAPIGIRNISLVNAAPGGGASSFQLFSISNLPNIPLIVSPANGSAGLPASLTARWNVVPFADSYRFQESRDSTFTTVELDTIVSDTVQTLNNLQNGRIYFIRLNAHDTSGTGAWSLVDAFTIIPALSIPVQNIAFGAVMLDSAKICTMSIKNTSMNAVTISSIAANTSAFTAASSSASVAAGDSAVLTVKFRPASFGTFIDTVTIVSDGGTVKMAVDGTSPIPALINLKPSIAFGNVARNMTKTDTLKIINSSINTLIVDSIYTKTGPFTVNRISGTAGTDTLKVLVSFMPTALSVCTDSVYLHNNTAAALVKVPLSGNCPVPSIQCSPRSVAFGNVGIYDSAKSVIKIFNPSINILTVDSIYTHSAAFISSPSFCQSANGDTAAITVRFKPVKFGVFSDTLFLRNNSDTALFKVTLSGNTPASSISIIPSSISFGPVPGDSTRQVLFAIVDSSISVLQIDSLWTRTKYFNVTRILAYGLVKKGDTSRVTIRFTPDSLRSYVDTMFIANNSPVSPYKVPLSGGEIITGVSSLRADIPTVFSLKQNFPNPFNPSTTVQYGLPVRCSVRIMIYNILGQVVKELVRSEQNAGYQSVVWNSTAASGIYFYRLEAASLDNSNRHFVETKKMLLLK